MSIGHDAKTQERDMLLLDIEKHIESLSHKEKEQLIRDIQRMLNERDFPVIEGSRFQHEWDFQEMAAVAANLKAYEATLTGPTRLDESKLVYMEGCDR
jgi:hypothetical protein